MVMERRRWFAGGMLALSLLWVATALPGGCVPPEAPPGNVNDNVDNANDNRPPRNDNDSGDNVNDNEPSDNGNDNVADNDNVPTPTPELAPLTEMTIELYKGEVGGLYPDELNLPPADHAAAGLAQAALVVPRDEFGNAADDGLIVMLGVGMSNAAQEFAVFERQADLDTTRNPRLVIINGAEGAVGAGMMADPANEYWTLLDGRLVAMDVSPEQVQVVWLKNANGEPPDDFPGHAEQLEEDLRTVVLLLKARFINLRLCYLSSRTYGGYAITEQNPEPQAFETAFSVRWLIEAQIDGDPALSYAADLAPWMAWGPYLWANGSVPRAEDGLVWLPEDFEDDGTHPAPGAEQKVADLLSEFFAQEETAAGWYPSRSDADTSLAALDAVEDATVYQSALPVQPDPQTLSVGGPDGGAQAWIKFDLTGVPRPVILAKLSLRATTEGEVYAANVHTAGSDWSEATINVGNAPAVSDTVVATLGQISRDGSISSNVTAAVNATAGDTLTLVIQSVERSTYLSRDSGQPPRLVITTADAP